MQSDDSQFENADSAYDAVYHTDLAVGEILRRARVHYGLSLQDVERSLRIRASQLESIEGGDLSSLPGRVYAIGFVRSYSEFLGLDGDKMVTLFKRQYVGMQQRPELHFPVPASESKLPGWQVMTGAFAGLVAVIAMAAILMPESKTVTIPDVPAEIAEVVDEVQGLQTAGDREGGAYAAFLGSEAGQLIVKDGASMNGQDFAQIQPAAGNAGRKVEQNETARASDAGAGTKIVINATDASWMQIRDAKGKVIFSRVLKTGESYTVPEGQKGLVLDTGNAGGLQFMVNGIEAAPIGGMGKIRRDVALTADTLKPAETQLQREDKVSREQNRAHSSEDLLEHGGNAVTHDVENNLANSNGNQFIYQND